LEGFVRFASLLLEAWRELEAFNNFSKLEKEVWRQLKEFNNSRSSKKQAWMCINFGSLEMLNCILELQFGFLVSSQ
jgi:hypothetical protein